MGIFDWLFGGKSMDDEKKSSEEVSENNTIRANSNECEDIGIVTHYKGKPLTGIYYELFGNMKIKREVEMIEGLKNGLDKCYFESGQLESEGNWKDDKQNGLSKFYFENGQLKEESNWKDGKQEGLSKFYSVSGKLEAESNYKNGKKNGEWKSYDKSGKLFSIRTCENDKVISDKHFKSDGTVIDLPVWFNGTIFEEGDTVSNPFSGGQYKLTNLELSMYDFIMGAQMIFAANHELQQKPNEKLIKEFNKGLEWFKETVTEEAYEILIEGSSSSQPIIKDKTELK